MTSVFGERLKLAMGKRNVRSAAALARILQIPEQTCRQYVNGSRTPTDAETLGKIYKELDVSPEWMRGIDPPVVEEVVIRLSAANGAVIAIMAEKTGEAFRTLMSNPEGLSIESLTVTKK